MARVLVIDDNEDLQDTYELMLQGEGYEVRRASDGLSGLHAVASERPDVVLLDMMMPEVDGLQFLARLPLECPDPLPQVVAMSGFDAYREEALRRGAHTFLHKPVELDVLLEAVHAAAGRQPVAANVLRHNAEDVVSARARADLLRDELVQMLEPPTMLEVKARLRALMRWLHHYYGFGATLVQLEHGDQLRIEACDHAPLPWREGFEYPRNLSYCADVVDAGEVFALGDPLHHPAGRYSRHPGTEAGVRFYAGAPLTTWSGAVIGTICLADIEPHVVHAEDMRLLEALGLHVAHALEELAAGLATDDFVIDEEGLFAPELLPLLTQVAVQRAARAGGVVAAGILQLAHIDDADAAARAAYEGASGPGVAVARRGIDELAVVVTGHGEARRTLADSLAACVRAVDVRAVGSAFCRLAAGSTPEVTGYDSDLAARLLELAAETRHTGLIEGALEARLQSQL
jgi:CheY-like chemotaxis protein